MRIFTSRLLKQAGRPSWVRKWAWIGAWLALVAPRFVSAADVVITSEQQSAEVVALGFTDIRCVQGEPGSLPYLPGSVLKDDLEFSGRFKLTTAPQFDSSSKTEFKQAGALAYIQGKYTLVGSQFTFECDLLDIDTQEKILGKKFNGSSATLRQSVHQFADEMVWQLFGERGIARSKMAFVSKRAGNKEIIAMDYDGFGTQDITRNKTINLTPIFLGTKDKVLFTSYLAGMPNLYVADVTSRSIQPLFKSKFMCSAPSFNKLDKDVVYASSNDGNSEIYRRPADGTGKATRLTFHGGIDTSPSWSPNGYEIVFMSDRSGKPMLYIMDRDGANVRRITYDQEYYGSPAWSPKGDRIACSVMDEGNNFSIWSIGADGNDPRKLTSGGGSNESPTWSPDSRHIAYMSTRTGSSEIWVMRADGTEPRRLSFTGGNSMPSWSDF
jgi:TolB protein